MFSTKKYFYTVYQDNLDNRDLEQCSKSRRVKIVGSSVQLYIAGESR